MNKAGVLGKEVRGPKIFKRGDIVSHPRLGEGVVVSRWGDLKVGERVVRGRKIYTYEDCSHILTVDFEHGYHSCKEEFLSHPSFSMPSAAGDKCP
jgi:hypothetical protein